MHLWKKRMSLLRIPVKINLIRYIKEFQHMMHKLWWATLMLKQMRRFYAVIQKRSLHETSKEMGLEQLILQLMMMMMMMMIIIIISPYFPHKITHMDT